MSDVNIRGAEKWDASEMHRLLEQIFRLHQSWYPERFQGEGSKYTIEQIEALIGDSSKVILVAGDNPLKGYIIAWVAPDNSLFVDDLCVDEAARGQHIGDALMEAIKQLAQAKECSHVTLNVWEKNEGAKRFYERKGFKPLKTILTYNFDDNQADE